jgi:hypothetical protein
MLNAKRRSNRIAAQQYDARKHQLRGDLLQKMSPSCYTRGQQPGDSGMNNVVLSRRYPLSLIFGCFG